MKTLLLSNDDIQNFSKLIYDPKTVKLAADAGRAAGCNFMALQYYLKNPKSCSQGNHEVQVQEHAVNSTSTGHNHQHNPHQEATQQQQQQHHHQPQQQHINHNHLQNSQHQHHQQQQLQLQHHNPHSHAHPHPHPHPHPHTHPHPQQTQQHQQILSQSQLKQLQLKQPTIHQQHSSYLQHHPYYQQPTPVATTHVITAHHPIANAAPASVVVHTLNQNSNFSAASSSTGCSSSNAPTQRSSATGSSLSPGGVKCKSGSGSYASNSAANATVRQSNSSSTKKIKTEPVLSKFQQTERFTFANTHLVWSEENWKRVVFQDERKFNLDGPDGFSYYFHDLRNYERTLSQRPRGNSVHIYFVITSGGPVHIDVSTTKLKTETCVETILRERVNIVEKLGGNSDFVLQDHNWSVNALPTVQNWLCAEGIKTQKWPTIAHDLNIMENIWGWLIREVYDGGRKFSRKDDLIFRIREAWSRLPIDLVNNLYSTLPQRISELYYTRGVYTNC